jgi:hypothetical protein
MIAVDLHHQHLQRRWAREQGLVEERRQLLLVAAGRAAEALRERWPLLQGVWLLPFLLRMTLWACKKMSQT